MTHVFIVNKTTFKYHLEYMFAGTGANKDDGTNKIKIGRESPFLTNPKISNNKNVVPYINSSTERMLVGMIADVSRIRKGDKIIFYLQGCENTSGKFFGTFIADSNPFFDENNNSNYLKRQLLLGLSYRVLIKPDIVYPEGLTEHEFLDSLDGVQHPYDLCWSLIYRKLKGNRGCTMITDYEYADFVKKLKVKNNNRALKGPRFSFDDSNFVIINSNTKNAYKGIKNSLDILPRLVFKYKQNTNSAFEAHLQAYLTQNFDKPKLINLLLPYPKLNCWIGNEVSCGVGMQRIDLMLKQETKDEVAIRLIELKCVVPTKGIVTDQIPWYLDWLSYYVIPKYLYKKVRVIPTIIARGKIPLEVEKAFKSFSHPISGVSVDPLEYIGFDVCEDDIDFTKYL